MNNYQQSLIEEHSQLIVRTNKLNDYIYSNESNKDNKIEFANKCIQLTAMKKYEEALRARMENANIVFEEGEYFERIASINVTPSMPEKGSDFDVDKENTTNGK